jgi:hypothetical protein
MPAIVRPLQHDGRVDAFQPDFPMRRLMSGGRAQADFEVELELVEEQPVEFFVDVRTLPQPADQPCRSR